MRSATKPILEKKHLEIISQKTFSNSLKSYKELTEGWFNTAYLIEASCGKEGVVKVAPSRETDVMTYEQDIIEAEYHIMTLVDDETDIPIPKVLHHDFSESEVPYRYFIMEKLDGSPYIHLKEQLDEQDKYNIMFTLGEYTKKMNALTGDKYGYFGDSHKKFDTWYLAFRHMVQCLIDDAKAKDVDLGFPYNFPIQVVDQLKPALDVVDKPSLIHTDLWDGNFFVHESEITGIIDFERAAYGDILMEYFCWADGGKDHLKGIGINPENTPYFKERTLLYRFYMALVLVIECPYRKYEDQNHIKWVRNNLIEVYGNVLDQLSKPL